MRLLRMELCILLLRLATWVAPEGWAAGQLEGAILMTEAYRRGKS